MVGHGILDLVVGFAKQALKIRMLRFLPNLTANAPAKKLDIRLPIECRLTRVPHRA